jgi:FkbM family methyltransferase
MINSLKEFIYRRYNISFSKAGDDIQLMKLIKNQKPGTYVDIGCWHPKNVSNTYYFYLRDWRGICIDPNPELQKLYKQLRPKDTFIHCGIGGSEENLNYYMLDEASSSMNTFDLDFLKKHDLENRIQKTLQIPVYTLKKILGENLKEGERLDFFDIDVEGLDLEVLKSNDWKKYRPKIIVVETEDAMKNDLDSEMVAYLEAQDYSLIGKSVMDGTLGNLFLINNRFEK